MIKVMWLLKRADGLSLSEFREWWLERHRHDVIAEQGPHLSKYIINIRVDDERELAGKPASEPEWDGVAEQWFETADDYNAVYAGDNRANRDDVLAHTSRFQRLVVTEHPQALR